ncbi:MAG: hypothetical protein WC307_05455, partial [Candidatus Nanoarchaeia archaeon]
MRSNLKELIDECSQVNRSVFFLLNQEVYNTKSRLTDGGLIKLVDETITLDYSKAINLLTNLNNLTATNYFKLMQDAKLLGFDGYSNDELINQELSIQVINEFISSIEQSDVYLGGVTSSKNEKLTEIKSLVNDIKVCYPYMLSFEELSNGVIDESHPSWLTDEALSKNIDLFINSTEPKVIKSSSESVVELLNRAYAIVRNWNYCNDDGCNNFTYFAEVDGDVICEKCGLVLREREIVEETRQAFSAEEIKQRWHYAKKVHDYGSRTIIRGKIDAKGQLLTSSIKSKYVRLSKINNSLISSYERNLWNSEPKLRALSNFYGKS